MTVKTVHANGALIRRALGLDIPLPIHAVVGVVEGVPVCAGGLTWGNGRCWLWFHVEQPARVGLAVIRGAQKMLRVGMQLGEPAVYTVRDPTFETSERLLKMLGFHFYGVEDGQEVHIWQH